MERNPIDQLKKTTAGLRNIFTYVDELSKYFAPSQVDLLKSTVDMMENHFFLLAEDKQIVATGPEKSKVKEALNILNGNSPSVLPPIYIDLIYLYTLLAWNWNEQLGLRPDMKEVILELRAKLPKSTSEPNKPVCPSSSLSPEQRLANLNKQLDELEKKIKVLSAYAPPVFELSRHYLEILKKELANKPQE